MSDKPLGFFSNRILLVGEILFVILNLLFFGALAKKAIITTPVPPLKVPDPSSLVQEKPGVVRMNILGMGMDSVDGTHRTDTILLAGVDLSTPKVTLVSIPRDTRVVIDRAARKINEIFARYGTDILRTLIEELMEIRINRHVKVDFKGFTNIIDLIGGIDLIVEHPMNYDDNYGNVHIHFSPGPVHLDGKKALEYVRFRADAAADLGRIKRQQRFIAAVIEKVTSPGLILKIPDILKEAFKNIDTDLTLQETIDLAYHFQGKSLQIYSESLPGEAAYIDRVSYFLPLKPQAVALGAKSFADNTALELEATFTPRLASETQP